MIELISSALGLSTAEQNLTCLMPRQLHPAHDGQPDPAKLSSAEAGYSSALPRQARLLSSSAEHTKLGHLRELTTEGVGFEPTVTHATLVFKTNTIDHSDTLPDISQLC